jgi:hypothetical protein
MIIEINDEKTIGELSDEFTAAYPFLKIAFFKHPHNWQEKSRNNELLPSEKRIGEVRTKHNPGAVEIHTGSKTGTIEQDFAAMFGLNVQILRHHTNEWVQTIGSDELTIAEQNEIGMNASQDLLHDADHQLETEKNLEP